MNKVLKSTSFNK